MKAHLCWPLSSGIDIHHGTAGVEPYPVVLANVARRPAQPPTVSPTIADVTNLRDTANIFDSKWPAAYCADVRAARPVIRIVAERKPDRPLSESSSSDASTSGTVTFRGRHDQRGGSRHAARPPPGTD
jgi:hypothetical protein